MEKLVAELLAGRNPNLARSFIAAWEGSRMSSWADAAREAEKRAASGGHLPQIRGQLRYHLGEIALRDAAKAAKAGAIPIMTVSPGGTFIVARVGRFALVSLIVRERRQLPRRSVTRKLLSQPNQDIDPQARLQFEQSPASSRGATELAYFGCLVAVPGRDPKSPSELVLGVTNAGISEWVCWMPFHRLNALLNDQTSSVPEAMPSTRPSSSYIEDRVFPTFRLPAEEAEDDAGA